MYATEIIARMVVRTQPAIDPAEFKKLIAALTADKTEADHDRLIGELCQKVIVKWPWAWPITPAGYDKLTVLQSVEVGRVLFVVIMKLAKREKRENEKSYN